MEKCLRSDPVRPKLIFGPIAGLLLLMAGALTAMPQQSAMPALPSDIPSTARHYVVLLVGGPAGKQASWTTSDGALHIFFQYNDRGRGPATTSILHRAPVATRCER